MIKQLRDQAAKAYADGRALQKQFEGKELPSDQETKIDAFFDEAEKALGQVDKLEKQERLGKALTEPVATHPHAGVEGKASPEAEILRKSGMEKFLRRKSLTPDEAKALSVSEDIGGGLLVANTNIGILLQKMKDLCVMRQICKVLSPIAAGSSSSPSVDSELEDVEFTSEIGSASEDDVTPFGGRMLSPHPLSKLVKISNSLLRGVSLDLEGWVNAELAYKFRKAEENTFINGTGAQQPMGLLKSIKSANSNITTTAVSNDISGDDVIDWIYGLKAAYAVNARVLCNRSFIRKIRKLKDVNKQYIWQPGLQAGSPNQILDVPYINSDLYDDGLDTNDAFEDSAIVAVVGDFGFYWIQDSLNFTIQVLDQLYARNNQTGYIGRKETDGMCVLPEAFRGLVIKA